MTTKEIYESIDQSKISPKGKDFLQKAEKSTKGFTIENEKLETVMRKIYKDLKERKPEALKNVKVKTVEVTEKVPTTKTERKKEPKKTTKTVKKRVKKASGTKKNPKPTKTPSTPKEGKKEHISTRASKLAKKEGITFKEARAKISKLVKEESKKAEKQTEKELDKLLAFVRKESFEGEEKYPKTYGKQKPESANLSQDAKRRAKPVGKRVSKNGKTYYEYRDNRSDRNSLPAPKGQYRYKGKTPPFLEAGGTLPTPFGQAGLVGETGAMNEMDLFAMGGTLPQGVHQYYANTYNPAYPTPHGYAKGGEVKNYEVSVRYLGSSPREYTVVKENLTKSSAKKLADKINKERKYNGKKVQFAITDVALPFAKGGMMQGYNDRLDESLGNRDGVEPMMMQSFKDRRDESKGMEKSMGRRAYQSVGTMDKIAKGGKVKSKNYIVELRYIGLPINESMIGKPVMSEETLDRLEDEFKQDITFTPIDETKMKPLSYDDSRKFILDFDRNFKNGLLRMRGYAKGGKLENNTFANVLKKYGFKEQKSVMGVRIFYNPKKDIYASVDNKNRLVEVFEDNDIVSDDMIQYSGYSVIELIKFLSKNKFAKGGSIPQSAKDEFYQLREDDVDFADQYGENDLREWYEEQGRFAKGGMMQGYNDRLDESLGNRNGVEPMMMQSFKDRRDESKGMEKAMGRRAYQSVGTMDKMAKGGVVSKMSYDEFIETLQPYEIEGGFGETIRKGMKMYYLKPTHPMYNYNFDYQNKRKAYKEYVDYISQEGNEKFRESRGYAKGGEIASAIFNPNSKKGKISTSFGDKTKEGLTAMIENDSYSPTEIANAIFYENDTNNRVETNYGTKSWSGLLSMIESARDSKMAKGGEIDNRVGKKVKVDFRKEVGKIINIENDDVTVFYPELGFSEVLDAKEVEIIFLPNQFAKGGEIDAFIMSYVKGVPEENTNLRVDTQNLTAKLKKGGKLGFDGLAKKVAKRYEGKPVEKQFQNEYGKTYSKEEAMEVGRKVAGKVYRQQQAMAKGGATKQGYDYVPQEAIDELSYTMGKVSKSVSGSNVLSGAYVKSGAKAKTKSKGANDLTKRILAMTDDEDKTKVILEKDVKEMQKYVSDKLIIAFYLGLPKAYDFKGDFSYEGGVISYRLDAVKKTVSETIKNLKASKFEMGLKYPSYDFEKLLGKPLEIKDIKGKKQKWINDEIREYAYKIWVWKDCVIGDMVGVYEDGKYKDYTYGSEATLNGGYKSVQTSKASKLESIIEFMAKDKNGFVKDNNVLYNGLGGATFEALDKNKIKYEAGGTLPTPFGQAGLVGETGAMNEMDLFAMGGGLPQGVQQYYANTYNPAYPTPHGYAKGGMLEIDTIYDNGGKSADRYTLIDEDGDMYGIGNSVNMYIGHRSEFPSDLSYLGKKVKYENLDSDIQKEIDKRLDTSNFAKGGDVKELRVISKELRKSVKAHDRQSKELKKIASNLVEQGKMAKGGEITSKMYDPEIHYQVVVNDDYDSPLYFKTFASAKKYTLANVKNQDNTIISPQGDSIEVEKNQSKKDLDFLFEYSMAKGGYIAKYQGKSLDVQAKSLYEAKQKAIKELKVPKSKQGILSIMSKDAYDNEEFRFMAKGGFTQELKRGHRVRVVNTQYDGKEGLIVAEETNGKYSVQLEDGKVKGIERENLMLLDRRTYAKGGKTQGYNDKLDESLGNTKGKRSTKEQNYKDRRNESEAMEKKGGKRKYARVKTMDKGTRKKRKTPMTLAKAIRRDGEKWQDAVKRATVMMKKEK